MSERDSVPDQTARTYRDGWLLRGRQLNDIYDALTFVVGRSPNGDPIEDIKALGAERDRLREEVAYLQTQVMSAGVIYAASDDECAS